MHRNIQLSFLAVMSITLTILLGGCGSGNREGNVVTATKVDEATCAQCHSTSVDTVAGTKIYEAYLASSHFTNNFHTVGCQDCHGGGSAHFGVGPIPYTDPSAAGICFSCHKNYLPPAHFYNITGAGTHPAMYVSKNYEKSCTSCHDPHLGNNGIRNGELSTVTTSNNTGNLVAGQPKPTEHADWADSAHGDVNGVAWATEDFKQEVSCIRCHTSTGYINYVVSGYTLPTTTWATPGDPTREVLTCKACHTSYNFKNRVRNAGAFTAPYYKQFNTTANVKYPRSGASNLCIACHSGRESGGSVAAITNFTNISAKRSHYLPSAEVFYGLAAFHFYSSNQKYFTGYNVGGDTGSWSHGELGMIDPATGNNFLSGGLDTGSGGPCVACHFGNSAPNLPNPRSHTLDPFVTANATLGLLPTATNNGCYGCHGGEDMRLVAEEEKALFDADMDMVKFTLAQDGIYYYGDRPNFRKADGTTEIKNWTTVGPAGGSGMNTMGAAFDYYLLLQDPGLHVHNRGYARSVIFDTIQYLQKSAVTYSNRGTTNNYYVNGVLQTYTIPQTGGQTDPNNLISFTAYSTAVANGSWVRPAGLGSVSQMKGHLLRSSGGKYYRR